MVVVPVVINHYRNNENSIDQTSPDVHRLPLGVQRGPVVHIGHRYSVYEGETKRGQQGEVEERHLS